MALPYRHYKSLYQFTEEGLFEVIIGLGTDIVVLQVFLAVECDSLGLYFSLFDIDLVSAEDNWDILADTNKITYLKPLANRTKWI